MENSWKEIIPKLSSTVKPYKELCDLYSKFPRSSEELSRRLAECLSISLFITPDEFPDFLCLSKLILEHANSDSKLLYIIKSMKLFESSYYNDKNVIGQIIEIYHILLIMLKDNINLKPFSEPLYKLSLKHAIRLYAHCYYKKITSMLNPVNTVIREFLINEHIKEEDLYTIKEKWSYKEWIGYLLLLRDLVTTNTNLDDLLNSVLLTLFKNFLTNVFQISSYSPKDQQVFVWINEIILHLKEYAIITKSKMVKFKTFINKNYVEVYKNTDGFKNANSEKLDIFYLDDNGQTIGSIVKNKIKDDVAIRKGQNITLSKTQIITSEKNKEEAKSLRKLSSGEVSKYIK